MTEPRLRLLWLTQYNEPHAFEVMAESLRQFMDVDIRKLEAEEQANLKKYFREKVDLNHYDRVMTILRAKKEMQQSRFMATIPGHIVLEYDACQNYMPNSKYRGKFSRHFKKLNGSRLIVSGYNVCEKLKSEGFEAYFLPKGYDDTVIDNFGLVRDIELGFIGKLSDKDPVYRPRKTMLDAIAASSGLQLLRTAQGEDYANTLNRIKIFVSADVGIGEYMAKNFEAMGAGCLLMTYSQGETENTALGFKDRENVVLYNNHEDFCIALDWLRANPDKIESIARQGYLLAREKFSYSRQAEKIFEYIAPAVNKIKKPSVFKTWISQIL